MPSEWWDEIITPQEREEVNKAVRQILLTMLSGRLVCDYLPELIDQRFSV
jgi:hypothetical protein